LKGKRVKQKLERKDMKSTEKREEPGVVSVGVSEELQSIQRRNCCFFCLDMEIEELGSPLECQKETLWRKREELLGFEGNKKKCKELVCCW
jgi:hypothetical protein